MPSQRDNESKPLLYGPDGKPLAATEKPPEAETTRPLPQGQQTKFQKLCRIKAIQKLWQLGKLLVALILGFATLITLWQFVLTEPVIIPLDFGARGQFRVQFTVHNSLLTSMCEVRVRGVPGAINFGPNPDDLRTPVRRLGRDPCQRLDEAPDLAVSESNYPSVEPGRDVVFPTGMVVERTRMIFAVAVRYRQKLFGIVPLWHRSKCQEFQTVSDAEGRTHFVSQ